MFLFKTVHSTSIRLFCSVIYRGVESGWSVYKRQMQLGIENREPCGWSDPGLTEGSRKPVAFHGLWIRSTARTHLPSKKERSVLGDESSQHTHSMPVRPTCPTSILPSYFHPTCFKSYCGSTTHVFCLQPVLAPKCPFNSCKEPHVAWQYCQCALAVCMARFWQRGWAPEPHRLQQENTWNKMLLCRRHGSMKPPDPSASVFKTISQAKGRHASRQTQPVVIAFQIYLHSLWGVSLCQNRNHRLLDHKSGEHQCS